MINNYTGTPLPKIPGLVSLSSTVHLHSEPLQHFQPILSNSPVLHSLHVEAYRATGCVIRGYDAPSYLCYDPSTGPKLGEYPQLVNLRLDRFTLSSQGARIMNWSKLQTLTLHQGDPFPFLQALVPTSSSLPSLRDFTLHTWYTPYAGSEEQCREVVAEFLSTARELRFIELEGAYNTLVDIISKHHGNSLEKLCLHQPEMYKQKKVLMSFPGLCSLAKNCLNLRELALDLDNSCSLPADNSKGRLVNVSCSSKHPLSNISSQH
jgi:hypothetical protein